MSKAVGNAIIKMKSVKNAASRFSPTAAYGNRILPSITKNTEYQLRIDAGHFDKDIEELDVNLQVNSQAKSPELVDWRKKNSTHARLATEKFSLKAADKDAEIYRALDALAKQAKEKLG
ncbi:MAG: hypothetical protein Q9218_003236 [Villophora microphyllina]